MEAEQEENEEWDALSLDLSKELSLAHFCLLERRVKEMIMMKHHMIFAGDSGAVNS